MLSQATQPCPRRLGRLSETQKRAGLFCHITAYALRALRRRSEQASRLPLAIHLGKEEVYDRILISNSLIYLHNTFDEASSARRKPDRRYRPGRAVLLYCDVVTTTRDHLLAAGVMSAR